MGPRPAEAVIPDMFARPSKQEVAFRDATGLARNKAVPSSALRALIRHGKNSEGCVYICSRLPNKAERAAVPIEFLVVKVAHGLRSFLLIHHLHLSRLLS